MENPKGSSYWGQASALIVGWNLTMIGIVGAGEWLMKVKSFDADLASMVHDLAHSACGVGPWSALGMVLGLTGIVMDHKKAYSLFGLLLNVLLFVAMFGLPEYEFH